MNTYPMLARAGGCFSTHRKPVVEVVFASPMSLQERQKLALFRMGDKAAIAPSSTFEYRSEPTVLESAMKSIRIQNEAYRASKGIGR